MEYIENKTFDEIKVGDSACLARTLTPEDIKLFAVMSGDINPAHVDEEYARSDVFHKIVAHGMWGGSLISTLLGTKLPGPGTIYVGHFRAHFLGGRSEDQRSFCAIVDRLDARFCELDRGDKSCHGLTLSLEMKSSRMCR